MKKQLCLLVLCALILSMFSACGHEHSYGNWKTEKKATCEKEGRKVRACDCGEEETKSIPKLEHAYESSIDQEAVCEQDGVEKFTCKLCDDSYTEPIPKLEHEYEISEEKDVSCEEDGVKTYTCKKCQDSYTETSPKLEHNYEITKEEEASCQGDGERIFTCSRCDDSYAETLSQTSYTATEIYEMYLNSVGEIITYNGSGAEYALGSCFVYADDGILITNYHVMEGARSAKVTFGKKTYEIQRVLAYDKNIDLAVLEISANRLEPAVLCDRKHNVGEAVYAFGNSRGLTSTFSDGMITYSDRVMDGIHYVQHDAPISGGNSGGPLINIYGEVIGINTWTVRDSQNLNFAIAISELENLDYEHPLTMEEFYQAEGNAYQRIVNYIVENSEYEDESYFMTLDQYDSSDNQSTYTILGVYYPEDEELLLSFVIDSGYYVFFFVDQSVSGVYEWQYFDEYDDSMSGILYAQTYDEDSLLGYDAYDLQNIDDLEATRELASSMVNVLCANLTAVFSEIGVTAADLGFLNY